MTREFIYYVAAACILAGGPAWADTTATSSPPQKTTADGASVSMKTAGLLLATVVGMPISAVRRAIHAEVEGTHGIVGDTDKKYLLIPAGAFWLPFALATGVMEAPGCSLKNSFNNFDKPFSKDQFSLGEMNDEK